jgi:hypothetical protein
MSVERNDRLGYCLYPYTSTCPVCEKRVDYARDTYQCHRADAEGKKELEPDILKRATVVADNLRKASIAGEINVPIWQKLFSTIIGIDVRCPKIIHHIGREPGMAQIRMLVSP